VLKLKLFTEQCVLWPEKNFCWYLYCVLFVANSWLRP